VECREKGNKLEIIIDLVKMEKLESFYNFNSYLDIILKAHKNKEKILIEFTNESCNLSERYFIKFFYELVVACSDMINKEIAIHLQDIYFFTFRNKVKLCYFFLISTENTFMREYENIFFFKSYMEAYYLNNMNSDSFKELETLIESKSEVIQQFEKKLIFKLKDFHIYLGASFQNSIDHEVHKNLDQVFELLGKYRNKFEVICLKFNFQIDYTYPIRNSFEKGNFLEKIMEAIRIFRGYHIVLKFNGASINEASIKKEIKRIFFEHSSSSKMANTSYINFISKTNVNYKLMKSRDCLSFYSFLYATKGKNLSNLRNKRAILLNMQKHFMSSTIEIIEK
jgi:hypothetical protein